MARRQPSVPNGVIAEAVVGPRGRSGVSGVIDTRAVGLDIDPSIILGLPLAPAASGLASTLLVGTVMAAPAPTVAAAHERSSRGCRFQMAFAEWRSLTGRSKTHPNDHSESGNGQPRVHGIILLCTQKTQTVIPPADPATFKATRPVGRRQRPRVRSARNFKLASFPPLDDCSVLSDTEPCKSARGLGQRSRWTKAASLPSVDGTIALAISRGPLSRGEG